MEADIISMSWTFKIEHGEDTYEEKFVELIKTAVSSKKVILFGSLPDKGPAGKTPDYAPVGLRGVIKIGSATPYGQASKENEFANSDFTLPDEEITMEGKGVHGSSFSTAYASGLAALILCCLKAHKELKHPFTADEAPDPNYGEKTKRLEKAMTFEGMREIFKVLSHDEVKGRNFLRPYITFGDKFDDSEEGKYNAMQRIASEILPENVLRELK